MWLDRTVRQVELWGAEWFSYVRWWSEVAAYLPLCSPGPLRMPGPDPPPPVHRLYLLAVSPQVDKFLRGKIRSPGLPAMSAIVTYNDTVLWTGNFGRKNGSDPSSPAPNEYTIYR